MDLYYNITSLHLTLQVNDAERLCWTHTFNIRCNDLMPLYKSIFYELPYQKTLSHLQSLDVMHIEKNVFNKRIGIFIGLYEKSKDDMNARLGLKELRIRKSRWEKEIKLPQSPYTVLPEEKVKILEMIKYVKYPHCYALS